VSGGAASALGERAIVIDLVVGVPARLAVAQEQ
jgi:hypothetical protein